ncbi:MAG: hypothetical protein JNM62_10730 [Flavobacteriales bacterium]|nr:hypothetical protein [Flavobacteriales bacterium]
MKVLLLALVLSSVFIHDFFVSILTVRHVPATRTLDLTWRITAHDIEHALENVAALKLASANEHPKADSILNAYFHDHLKLNADGKALDWAWVGKELDGETLYCYVQVMNMDSLSAFTVSNTLLQDLFYEQQNLVHVEREGAAAQSHTFTIGADAHTFSW